MPAKPRRSSTSIPILSWPAGTPSGRPATCCRHSDTGSHCSTRPAASTSRSTRSGRCRPRRPSRTRRGARRGDRSGARPGDGRVHGGSPPTAAVYQRRGYVTGGDTLTGELLAAVGFDNAGGELAGDRGGFVRLERLIAEPPDFLLVTTAAIAPADQGEALLAHPALADLFPASKRIVLPERLTVCGGPSLPAALDWLSSEARRVRQGR